MDSLIQSAEIRESRKESQHIDQVIPGSVNVNDLFHGKPRVIRDILNIGAILSAVAYGDLINLFPFCPGFDLHF